MSLQEMCKMECVIIDDESNGSCNGSEDNDFKYEVSLEPAIVELCADSLLDEDPVQDSGEEEDFKYEVALEPECVVPVGDLSESRDHDATVLAEQETCKESPSDNACRNCGTRHADRRTLLRHVALCVPGTPKPNIINFHSLPSHAKPAKNHSKSHVTSHTQSHTQGEIPFTCEVCKKQFALLNNFKQHMRIHNRKISCVVCLKTFASYSLLRRHEVTHFGVKNFTCNICDEKCPTMTSLTIHERTHTGEKIFSCKSCSKSFTNASSLKIHEYIHTGEKPYACEVCKKQFTQRSHLNNHMRVHTGEKPYLCEYCLKTFAILGNYKAHKRIHLK